MLREKTFRLHSRTFIITTVIGYVAMKASAVRFQSVITFADQSAMEGQVEGSVLQKQMNYSSRSQAGQTRGRYP